MASTTRVFIFQCPATGCSSSPGNWPTAAASRAASTFLPCGRRENRRRRAEDHSVDVLRLPAIGPLLGTRHFRLTMQIALLVLSAVIVWHGLFGPQIAPRNLSTVLTSIHWRGLLIVALLAIGNVFCFACPLVLARDAGRRLVAPRLSWPRGLRRKW